VEEKKEERKILNTSSDNDRERASEVSDISQFWEKKRKLENDQGEREELKSGVVRRRRRIIDNQEESKGEENSEIMSNIPPNEESSMVTFEKMMIGSSGTRKQTRLKKMTTE
jgi:hypothetical protein